MHMYEKYLHKDCISTMFYVFDDDVHVLTLLINIYQLMCTVYVAESLNLKRNLRVELLCAVILQCMTQKSDESYTCT